eukprot:6190389-Pleurochrysis_carterae.AAC.6
MALRTEPGCACGSSGKALTRVDDGACTTDEMSASSFCEQDSRDERPQPARIQRQAAQLVSLLQLLGKQIRWKERHPIVAQGEKMHGPERRAANSNLSVAFVNCQIKP